MKLLVVSDEESKFIWDHFDPVFFRGVEMIISCGDLNADYLSFIATMIPAPMFYVPGNHDAGFEKEPPGGCMSVDGNLLDCKGMRIAGLGGCMSAKPDAIYQYSEHAMRRRAEKLAGKIQKAKGLDIFVTHAPASGLGDGDDLFHRGFEAFRKILDDYKPRLHVFGHQHRRYSYKSGGPEYYGATKLVNACGYKIIEL